MIPRVIAKIQTDILKIIKKIYSSIEIKIKTGRVESVYRGNTCHSLVVKCSRVTRAHMNKL